MRSSKFSVTSQRRTANQMRASVSCQPMGGQDYLHRHILSYVKEACKTDDILVNADDDDQIFLHFPLEVLEASIIQP